MNDNINTEVQDEFDEVDMSEFLLEDGEETADQPETDQSAPETEESAGHPEQEAPAGETAEQPETFTLRWMDTTREVQRDEMVALAQKGIDYDRLRQQRDTLAAEAEALRAFRKENGETFEFLRDLAKETGMTAPELLDSMQASRYMQRGMTKEAATERVARERAERALDAAKKEQGTNRTNTEEEAAKKRNEDIQNFYARFPGVQPREIPKEVWERVGKGERLADAYAGWKTAEEMESLRAENERLKREIAAAEQNRKNRAKTVGSQSTTAGEGGGDAFLEALLSDD